MWMIVYIVIKAVYRIHDVSMALAVLFATVIPSVTAATSVLTVYASLVAETTLSVPKIKLALAAFAQVKIKFIPRFKKKTIAKFNSFPTKYILL